MDQFEHKGFIIDFVYVYRSPNFNIDGAFIYFVSSQYQASLICHL
jgi:hypothetical protein